MLQYTIQSNIVEVRQWYKDKGKNVDYKLSLVINDALKIAEGKAKEQTPVDTGTLKNSQRITQTATPNNISGIYEVTPLGNVKGRNLSTDYAIYQERGTRRGVRGKRFFLKAKTEASKYIDSKLKDLI
jgi:hypothetical protein